MNGNSMSYGPSRSGKSMVGISNLFPEHFIQPECYFTVERWADKFRVTFHVNEAEFKLIHQWFIERDLKPKRIGYANISGWEVVCDRDVAMLAKLSWGGVV